MARREKPFWMTVKPYVPPKPAEWGVFEWEPENMYWRRSAVRVYKREHAAQAYCDSHDGNLVVRGIRD